MPWHLLQINNVNDQGPTVPGETVACPQATASDINNQWSVCAFGNQLHYTYLDPNLNLQDCWYDGSTGRWHLQQINNVNDQGPTVPGETVACRQATAPVPFGIGAFVCAFGDQMHFTYVDPGGNLQDCWYDGPTNRWHLQQINNANGNGPTVPGEYVACPQATAPVRDFGPGGPFVCAFGDQQHFAYMDANGNIQDCWYDSPSGSWNLQQVNNGGRTDGPPVYGSLFVCAFGDQLHFAYVDSNDNLQDCWYDGAADRWHLWQINNAKTQGATVPGEYVGCPQATLEGATWPFVCGLEGQLHFTYTDISNVVFDCLYESDANQWNLWQINNVSEGPAVPGVYVPWPQATSFDLLFVCVFEDQLHFICGDPDGNMQDLWYDGAANQWNMRQINNANGKGATVPGEDVACPQATAAGAGGSGAFVCAFGDQLHYTYLDQDGNIQDCWFEPPPPNPCQSWIDQLADLSPGDFETLAEYKQAVAYLLGQLRECERAYGLSVPLQKLVHRL